MKTSKKNPVPALIAAACLSLIASSGNAQENVYFGKSCGAVCGALNDQGGTLVDTKSSSSIAVGHRAEADATIVALQLYTQSRDGKSAKIPCAIYRENASQMPEAKPVATGEMTILGEKNHYMVVLDAPVKVTKGETIYVVQGNLDTAKASALTTGTAPAGKILENTGSGWAESKIVAFPSYRILCEDDLRMDSDPLRVASRFDMRLRGAPAGHDLWIIGIGTSNPNINVLCGTLRTSLQILFGGSTANPNWIAAVPEIRELSGLQLYVQFWTLNTKTDEVAGTNGARITIG